MAYNVSDKFRKQCYSGVSMFTAKLTIGGVQVPYSQIKNIKISNPIIDTTQETFYLGTFISQQITITFRNLNNLNIESNKEVYLEIGELIDGEYEWCPIGKFLIDDLGENYQTTCQIVCLDYGVKFKIPIDYRPCMTNVGTEEEPILEATIDTILEYICETCGVELGTYPTVNGDILVRTYDSTISGKQWISYIAEIKGCNAKIGRDGKLHLIPLKRPKTVTINALRSKSWKLGERYEITHVTYQNAVPVNWTFPKDETIVEKNRLMLRQTNPFIYEESTVENIYDEVNGFVAYSVENENYGDPSMDAWDYIEFTLGEDSYTTFNHNETTFEQNIMTKINPKIPTKQQEVTVNVLKGDDEQYKRIIQSEIDTLNGKITNTIATVDGVNERVTQQQQTTDELSQEVKNVEKVSNNNKQELLDQLADINSELSEISTIENNVKQLQTSTYTKTQINQIVNGTGVDGVKVSAVVSISGTFDKDGMTYEKSNAETKTTINEVGVNVKDKFNKTLMFAGYVNSSNTDYPNYKNQTIVGTDNIIVKNYLIMGTKSRFEDYEDGTGIFYIG